ncbi:hypothetical protein Tco_0516325 [Tanacetum coccineum]
MVAYLEKSPGSAGFHQIIDFINRSHICYALTKKPEVCVSFIKQFWRTAAIVTEDNGTSRFMLYAAESSHSPSRSTSSPSPTPTSSPTPESTHTQPSPQPSPPQPSPTQPSPTHLGSEYHPPTPHDSPLHAVHSHGSDEGSLKLQELMNLINTLSDRVGVLEADLTKTKQTYNTEGVEDDSSKQGRKFSNEGFKDDEGRAVGKASDEISTAGKKKDTASEEVPPVSTAEVHISTAGETATYSRRSAEKRKDKGKGIMSDEEPIEIPRRSLSKKIKFWLKQLGLKKQMHEEQKAQIARDAEMQEQWKKRK